MYIVDAVMASYTWVTAWVAIDYCYGVSGEDGCIETAAGAECEPITGCMGM